MTANVPSLAAQDGREALERILKLRSNIDLPDGSNWTEADCFHAAKFIAEVALAAPPSPRAAPMYERTISTLAELAKAAEPFIKEGVDGYAHLCAARELIAQDDAARSTRAPTIKDKEKL